MGIPPPSSISSFASFPERAEATLKFLPWVEASFRRQLMDQADRLLALIRRRETRGLHYWDTRAAVYVANLKKASSCLLGGIREMAEVSAKMLAGSKRCPPERLDTIRERFLVPALALDFANPKYHPIIPEAYPGYGSGEIRLNERGRKISNSHQVDGVTVWLEWDFAGFEPSFWCCNCGNVLGLSEISPGVAVATAQATLTGYAERDRRYRSYPYTRSDLEDMNGSTLRRIAELRGLAVPGSRRLADLRAVIAQPQRTLLEKP